MRRTANKKFDVADCIDKKDILTLNDFCFLDEVRLLHNQEEKYLSADFCTKLENISLRMNEVIVKQKASSKLLMLYELQASKTISENTIDLCLECIEIYLAKISSNDSLLKMPLNFQALQILANVSKDLCILASCIKYTLGEKCALL